MPPPDPFAAVAEPINSDPFAAVLHDMPNDVGRNPDTLSRQAPGLLDTPGAVAAPAPLTTGQEMWRGVKGYAQVPEAALEQAVTQGGRALASGLHSVGLASQAAVDEESARAEAAMGAHADVLAGAPGAAPVANILGGTAAFAVDPYLAVAQMELNKRQDALSSGATPGQAAVAGATAGLSGSVLGPLASVAGPVVRPIAAFVGRAAPLVEHGIQNAGGMAALTTGDVAGTSVYDREQALRDANQIPAAAETGGAVGLLTGLLSKHPTPVRPDPFAKVAEPVTADPSADTQVMPVLRDDQITPPTWIPHGPINTEPIKSPWSALAREPTTEDLSDHSKQLDAAIDRRAAAKNIRATGEPVVGPEETQDNPVLQDEIATNPGTDARSRATIIPMNDIKTQAEGPRLPPVQHDQPTLNTADLNVEDVRRAKASADMARMNREQAQGEAAQSVIKEAIAKQKADRVAAMAADPAFRAQALADFNKTLPPEEHLRDHTPAEPPPTPDVVRGDIVGKADALHPETPVSDVVPPSASAHEPLTDRGPLGSGMGDVPRGTAKPLDPNRPLAAGDRVMVGLKGRPSEARIDAIHPDGRIKVTTADGRTLPAVKPDIVTRIEGDVPPKTANKPSAIPGPNANKPVAQPRAKAMPVGHPAPKASPVQSDLPTLNAEGLRKQFDALPINRKTPGLTDALMGIVDARAKSSGLSLDDYVGRHIARVQDSSGSPSLNQDELLQGERLQIPKGGTRFESLAKDWRKATGDSTPIEGSAGWQRLQTEARRAESIRKNGDQRQVPTERITRGGSDVLHQDKDLGQGPSTIKRGSVQFLKDGRAIIHAFEHADASTSLHELGHIFRRDLSGEDIATAEREMGVRNGKWARGHEEKFARMFERWMRDGKAPTEELKSVFAKFAAWLRNVYQAVAKSEIKAKPSPAMERLYARLLTKGAMKDSRVIPKEAPSADMTGPPSKEIIAERKAKLDAARGGPPPQNPQKSPEKTPLPKESTDKPQSSNGDVGKGATTSNANAISAETRKRIGVPERETPAGRSFDAMYDAGLKAASDPIAIPSLVEELRRNPERIVSSNAEAGMLLKRKVDLENDLERLRKEADDAHAAGDLNGELEARANLASQRAAVLEFTGLMERAGTAAGRALVARKMMSTMDHSLSHMESDAAAAKGAILTDAELANVKTLYQEIQAADEAVHKRLASLIENYENRIEDGDFSKKSKPLEPRDPETMRLRAKLESAKRQWREKVREYEKSQHTNARKDFDFVGNLPGQAKSLKASLDNSAVFRQGWRVMMTNPTIWTRNAAQTFVDAWRVLGGKHVMDEIHAELKSSPYYEEARRAKLAVIAPEEDFPVSLPARIPVLGRVFRASEEAYTGFQYRNRMQIFEKMMEVAKRSGVDTSDTGQLRSIGEMINSLTSRGHLGKLEPVGNILNNVFFSARKIKADLNFLTLHATDTGFSHFARKQALYNLVKVASGTAMILAIANAALPGSVETDPRSADFGKIKVGNTRYDVTGGVSSMLVLAARMFTGSTKSSTSGKVRQLNDGKLGSQTRADVIERFFGNKLSPVASIILNHLRGRTFNGAPPTLSSDAWDLLMPMAITNYMELQQATGATPESITAGVLADFMGIGTNTYSGGKPKPRHAMSPLTLGSKDIADEPAAANNSR